MSFLQNLFEAKTSFFQSLFSRVLPSVKADDEEEDLVDPQEVLRDECRENHCQEFCKKLDECNERVRSKTRTTETCIEELFDLLHCVDHCVTPQLFSKLK